MRPRELSYCCSICGWQGRRAPSPPDNDTICPSCGALLYPLSWGETWGMALFFIGLAVAFVYLFVFVLQ
jgi:hypothetical protein